MKNALICAAVLAAGLTVGLATPLAHADDTSGRGVITTNDGSFNYQGYLEVDGEPANGMYSFRFDAYASPAGPGIIHENFYTSPTVPVVDGLFDVDVQMGGTSDEAKRFWREVGFREMYLEIGVGDIEGGPYTTLGTRSKVGWSARAQYSGISDALQFPYIDTYSNDFANPETMIRLHNEFGGTVLEATVGVDTSDPVIYVSGTNPFDSSLLLDQGIIQANDLDRRFGVLAFANQFPILGLIEANDSSNRAAVLGEVVPGSDPNIIAVWALNDVSGNSATFGGGTYAGDFSGDVIVRDNLRVQGEPTRDYALSSPSPIGPLAYGSVSAGGSLNSGTANLSVSWDAGSSQYIVSVAGETMGFTTHTVSITVVDTFEPRVATFNTVGGDIGVKIWDLDSGNIAIQDNFSIVIYDPTATTLNRVASPAGMDEDKYTEKTGVQLIQTQPRNEPVEPFENYGSGVTGD